MDPYVVDLDHLASVIARDGFGPVALGGCSCPICARLRVKITEVQRSEAAPQVVVRYCQRASPHPAHAWYTRWGWAPRDTYHCPGVPAPAAAEVAP